MTDGSFARITTRDVMQRWAKCHDTWMIAQHLGTSEAEIARILAAEQDRKHRVADGLRRHHERLRLLQQRYVYKPF